MTTNQQALEAYMRKMAAICAIVGKLAGWAEDMGGVSPDDVDWAHVGDLTEVLKNVNFAASWAGIDQTTESAL